MDMNFVRQPMGLLNVDHLLERADSILRRVEVRMDVPVEFFWPVCLWRRIVEDADERGMTPPQIVRQIVRDYYSCEGEV